MVRFFARVFATLLAAAVLVIGVVLLAQLRPVGVGGWVFLALAALGVLGAPFLIYRGVMGQVREARLPNDGEGAGLVMGAAIDTARRRDDDADAFDFD